jgi:hypothetical protein
METGWTFFTASFYGPTMDVFSNSGCACCLFDFSLSRPSIFKFSFGISYEYQTIKLNDVLTLSVSFYIALSCIHHFTYLY